MVGLRVDGKGNDKRRLRDGRKDFGGFIIVLRY